MNYEYGRVKNLSEAETKAMKENRLVPVIASTSTKDRSGDILNMEGWDLTNFKSNPIIGYQHNVYGAGMCEPADSPDQIIGKGVNPRVEDGALMIDIQFKEKGRSELADKVFEDMADGYLNAVSVGFLAKENEEGDHFRKGDEKKGEDPEGKYFFGQELLELSVVNLPDNPTALRRGIKSQTTKTMAFLRKMTGLSFGEIENLTVKDAVDMIENPKKSKAKNIPEKPKKVTETKKEIKSIYEMKMEIYAKHMK